ncbi:Fimbrillin-like [Bacteroidales bacterium WCE2004]|nr:Fimbrillin-like [Bacteroidales bacterium WCE2004]
MKKSFVYISVLLLAAVACTREPLDVAFVPGGGLPAASDVPVAFAVGGPQTKSQAPITTLAALAAQDFSVSAWYSPEGEIFDGVHSVPYFANHRFGYVTSDLAGETSFSNAWQGVAPHGAAGLVNANPVYWPLDGTLSFFCYAPYREGDADIALEDPVTDAGIAARLPGYLPGSPLIRVTPAETAANQADFLASPALLDRSRLDDSGRFPLDFSKHRMTQVEFWFAYKGTLQNDPSQTQTFEQARVSSIEIRDVVGSKYCYFTEAPDRTLGCAWSEKVSPEDGGTVLPKTTYRLVSATGGELKTGLDASLEDIEEGGDYRFINDTPAGHLFLLPQKLPADAKLVVNYAILNLYAGTRVSEVVTLDLASGLTEWPEGKVVRYLLTLDLPERGVVGVKTQIIPWEDAGIPYYEQEMLY